jgi:rare lipoprotein A
LAASVSLADLVNRFILGLFAGLASCSHPPPPVATTPPKFVVGYPYQTGGEWRYPQVFNNYDATGVATVVFNRSGLTTDNETYDPDAIAAASPVLQLPSIVTVTNLANGYSMDVMVNDRGPDNPGRVLAVTPKVASLLGFPIGGMTEVEVTLKPRETAALDATLGQGPKLAAAPEASIQAQSLAPPGSAQSVGASRELTQPGVAAPTAAPAALSGTVTAVPPSAGPLFVQIPGFGRIRDARNEAAQLYGLSCEIVPLYGGDRTLYAINCGPYTQVQQADAALQQLLRQGITDPQIIVR